MTLGSSALSDLGQEENPVTFISPPSESHWSCWDERAMTKETEKSPAFPAFLRAAVPVHLLFLVTQELGTWDAVDGRETEP